MTSQSKPTILAVSSPGSRWAELAAITRSLGGVNVVSAGASESYQGVTTHYRITDFSLFTFWLAPLCALQLLGIILRHRPKAIISTGAAPGFMAIALGRVLGTRCIWIESLTSVDTMTLSGKLAGRLAHLWLTQSETLASQGGPQYRGATL